MGVTRYRLRFNGSRWTIQYKHYWWSFWCSSGDWCYDGRGSYDFYKRSYSTDTAAKEAVERLRQEYAEEAPDTITVYL